MLTAPISIITPLEPTRPARYPARRWEPLAVFVTTLVLLGVLVPRMSTYLNPVTGDEPFYLMTAMSILQDGDLNECNNYRQLDERKIYPAYYTDGSRRPSGWRGWSGVPFPLPPHPAILVPKDRMCTSTYGDIVLPVDGSGSELYSKHGLGLTLLVLPAFALGGLPWVQVFLVMLGAVLAANIYLLAREVTGQVEPAVLTWATFSLTVPLLPYSFLIFPEMPAALLVVYAYRRLRLWENNPIQVALVAACIAFLPWLHYRFAPVSLVLGAYWAYREWRSHSRRRAANLLVVLGVPAGSAALLMAFFHARYAQVLPNASDHAGSSGVAGTARGAMGLFFDEQWGLLVSAPIFLLAGAGVVLMLAERRQRAELLWLGAIFGPYFLLVANYAQWWGEWCPPARYLASVLPLMAVPFAFALGAVRSMAYRVLYALLMGVSLLMVWAYLYQPQWLYNHPSATGTNRAITGGLTQLLQFLGLTRVTATAATSSISDNLPSFVLPYFFGEAWSAYAWRQSILPASVAALVVALALGIAWRTGRGNSESRRLRRRASRGRAEADPTLESPPAEVV